MNTIKLLGFAFLTVGILALAYGGFTYTKGDSAMKLGAMNLEAQGKGAAKLPLWAGIVAILVGGFLLGDGGTKV